MRADSRRGAGRTIGLIGLLGLIGLIGLIGSMSPWHTGEVQVGSHRGSAALLLLALGCAEAGDEPAELELGDDPYAYMTSRAYRRAILERDLVTPEPIYAQVRLGHYASTDDPEGWDELPVVARPTSPLTLADAAELAATQELPALTFGPALGEGLGPEAMPTTRAGWVALGERVFFEFPMSLAPSIAWALRDGADLRDYGLLVHDDAYIGVRFVEQDGQAAIAVTCASCHASLGADGRPSGVRSNRAFDLGRLRLDFGQALEHHAVDETAAEKLGELGPGRSDVQADGQFNPYAFPDFGGIADIPYLHHTANWHNRGVATLAIRVETVFISTGADPGRPPRVLMWALAEYLRSLPAPPPVAPPGPASARGREVFATSGCDGCHAPPLYTSSERVAVDELGTDPAAGTSPARGTGYWRIPSLRGVGGNAPYLHHGAFTTLEAMFDPGRAEPGHTFGLDLDADARADLIAFLRTI